MIHCWCEEFWDVLVWTSVVCVCVCGLDAQPTEEEREVWNQVNSVLQDSESILMGLQAYKGAGQEIRDVRNLSSVYGHELYKTPTEVRVPKAVGG